MQPGFTVAIADALAKFERCLGLAGLYHVAFQRCSTSGSFATIAVASMQKR
jgi:hypothetical protein